jgi:hypothetical protein
MILNIEYVLYVLKKVSMIVLINIAQQYCNIFKLARFADAMIVSVRGPGSLRLTGIKSDGGSESRAESAAAAFRVRLLSDCDGHAGPGGPVPQSLPPSRNSGLSDSEVAQPGVTASEPRSSSLNWQCQRHGATVSPARLAWSWLPAAAAAHGHRAARSSQIRLGP